MLLNRSEFMERLVDNIVEVHFTKVNGDKRKMLCTLKPMYIGNDETIKPNDSWNPNIMNVWDVEKNDWRSFRLDSVNTVFCPANGYE